MGHEQDGVYYFHVAGELFICDACKRRIIDCSNWRIVDGYLLDTDNIALHRVIMGAYKRSELVVFKGPKFDLRACNMEVIGRKDLKRRPNRVRLMNGRGLPVGIRLQKTATDSRFHASLRKEQHAFSVNKYGYDEALRLAIRKRCEMIAESESEVFDRREWDAWAGQTAAEFYG